jgi:hypothetical protein
MQATEATRGHETPGGENPLVDHEESDVNVRAIFWFCAGLLILGIVVHLLMWGHFEYFSARSARQDPPRRAVAITGPQRPPEPRLQAVTPPETAFSFAPDPVSDLNQFRVREEELLRSYGWVDQPGGIVRIPIERALELIAQRGLPATAPKAVPQTPAAPTEGVPQP